jgi:hypothetical protein
MGEEASESIKAARSFSRCNYTHSVDPIAHAFLVQSRIAIDPRDLTLILSRTMS